MATATEGETEMRTRTKHVLLGIAVLAMLALACGGQSAGTAPTSTPKPRAECVPQVFEGTGTDVLELPFTLAGCTKARLDYVGKSNFIVWAHNVDNEEIELLANEIGTWSGTVKWDARAASLAIDASGRWKIEVMK